jgi:hypothetical protein
MKYNSDLEEEELGIAEMPMLKVAKENVLEYILACAKILDKSNARRYNYYVPLPDWMQKLVVQYEADQAALARFKKNSSYWPDQFPWCRNRYLGKIHPWQKTFMREYRPVFSS